MSLLSKTKNLSVAAIKAAKTMSARRAATRPPFDLKSVLRKVGSAANNYAGTVAPVAAKKIRNRMLDLDRNTIRALEDLVDLTVDGEKVMSRKEFLNRVKQKVISSNLPTATETARKKIPKF